MTHLFSTPFSVRREARQSTHMCGSISSHQRWVEGNEEEYPLGQCGHWGIVGNFPSRAGSASRERYFGCRDRAY